MTYKPVRQGPWVGLILVALMAMRVPGQRAPGVIDLAEVAAATLVAFGQNVGDQLRVLATDDYNADGLNDVLLGSFNADGPDNQRLNAGSAYIIFGNRTGLGLRDLGSRDDVREDVAFFGAEDNDRFSVSVASGDVTGDGIADLIIGAPGADGPGNSRVNAGEVYIFFGGPDLTMGTIRDVAEQLGRGPDITIFGEEGFGAVGDTLGASVALGDVNSDGLTDLIIGAPGTFGPGNLRATAGSVYILFGGPRLSARGAIDLADPLAGADVVIHGADPVDNAGTVVKAGDLNDDGIDDVVFSAPTADGPANLRRDAGEVYVLFGRRDLATPSVHDVAGIFAPGVDLTIFGQDPADVLGGSLLIGDVSGDSVKDLILGAVNPLAPAGADGPDNSRLNAGEVYLIVGHRALPGEGARDLAGQFGRPADQTIFGADGADQFGASLGLSDLNGDGVADLIIGAPGADGLDNQRTNAGEVYVLFGGLNLFNGLRRDIAGQVGWSADLTVVGAAAGHNFGTTLAAADMNGDGVDDLIISAPFAGGPDNVRANAGEAHVVSGK